MTRNNLLMAWDPVQWLSSSVPQGTSPVWVLVTADELAGDDGLFDQFQKTIGQPESDRHVKAVEHQMYAFWRDINWRSFHPNEIFRRQQAIELWITLWESESRLLTNSSASSASSRYGQFYQQLRHELENQWEWNFWVSRYLPLTRNALLWHEGACHHLLRRVQSLGPQRPYALTLCWKVMFSHHAPSRHYPVSQAARKYIQNLSPHLSWSTLSDYYVKRFLDWEKTHSGNKS